MNTIILSGGSGVRLWPLSNDVRSKQFLKLLEDSKGNPCSMLQRTLKMLEYVDEHPQTVIATGAQQIDIISSQLKKENHVDLVVEPTRRNTFPAIGLAVSYLVSRKGVPLDDPIVVLPVDQYADVEYYQTMKKLADAVKNNIADLVLIGVQPLFATNQYGYILPSDQGNNGCLYVEAFVEKPPIEKAEKLIQQGAFWNGGVFAFKARFIAELLLQYLNTYDYDIVLDRYLDLPKTSFDYAVAEVVKSRAVVPYNGTWKDLGSWATLTEEMNRNSVGKGYLHNCINTHLINELSMPIHAVDIDNSVIVATYDGILVSSKSSSPRLKDFISDMPVSSNCVEASWGSYIVLNDCSGELYPHIIKKMQVFEESKTPFFVNENSTTIITIVSGHGVFITSDNRLSFEPKDTFTVKPKQAYSIVAESNLIVMKTIIYENKKEVTK